MPILQPVLLAGGSGTRLWPLSRKSYPKQFSQLVDEKTLFQKSAERLTTSDTLDFAQHITVTNADFRFIIAEQLQEVGIDPGPILIEPEMKNTAAAILAASLFAHKKDPDAILIVAPSDHVIPDVKDFHAAIKTGLIHIHNGKVVTFGIKPTKPETGYGYLELSSDILDAVGTSGIVKFIEKPNSYHAAEMLDKGNFLWNAGIFLFRAQDMIDACETYAPKTLSLVSKSLTSATVDLGFLRLASEPWSLLDNISIDYAIMENAKNLVAVPYLSKWSDLGGWDAVWAESVPDEFGNVTSETAHVINCQNSLLRSESSNQQVVGVGLDNIMAIAMPDAVLVANKDHAQAVKKAVELLKSKNIAQGEKYPKDFRPWGWFESLVVGEHFQVKRIYVKPGGSLSLQSHKHRSEHWVVVAGSAHVTVDDKVMDIDAGQSVYVPKGAVHRMENFGVIPMILVEVQIGKYLGEDDIIRYDDVYKRV